MGVYDVGMPLQREGAGNRLLFFLVSEIIILHAIII